MDCKIFNEKINSFINDNIEEEELESFIEHYESCDNCKEEMDIYFMIHNIFDVNGIDSFDKSTSDFEYNLSEKITSFMDKKKTVIFNNYKKTLIFKMIFLLGVCFSSGVLAYFIYLLFFYF